MPPTFSQLSRENTQPPRVNLRRKGKDPGKREKSLCVVESSIMSAPRLDANETSTSLGKCRSIKSSCGPRRTTLLFRVTWKRVEGFKLTSCVPISYISDADPWDHKVMFHNLLRL